jgi:hypothetical protein
MAKAKPWTQARLVREALKNEHVEARDVPGKGRGLFAKRNFRKGDPVCALTGKLVPGTAAASLTPEERDHCKMNSEDQIIVPDLTTVGGHLANHSCDPNTEYLGDTESGRHDASVLRARKPIQAGSEVTVYYGWEGFQEVECLCGARHCTGYIGLCRWERVEGEWSRMDDESFIRSLLVCATNDNDAVVNAVQTLQIRHGVDKDRIRDVVIKAIGRAEPEEARWLQRQPFLITVSRHSTP